MEMRLFTIPYYASFGSPMPTRTWTDPNAKYKYGFNGKEKDDDVNVNGGSYDFGARIYDSRLGRWLALDPLMKKYPDYSPYIYANNLPLFYKDVDGRDIIPGNGWVGSPFSVIYSTLIQENNPIIQVINSYYTGKSSYNITLSYLCDISAFQPPDNDKEGRCDLTSSSPCQTSLVMNPSYAPLIYKYTYKDYATEMMDKQYGIGHYYKLTENNIGKTLALIHEFVHASLHAEGINADGNAHHEAMATKGTTARDLLVKSISAANKSGNWGLTDDQVTNLSYSRVGTETKGFQDFMSQKAGLENSNWMADKNSTDPDKKANYDKNLKSYQEAYVAWKKDVDSVINDKKYYDSKGGEVVTPSK